MLIKALNYQIIHFHYSSAGQNNGEDFISQNYNVDLANMDDEEKMDFLDRENENLQSKVLDLSSSLKIVLDKVKDKTVSKPPQVSIHKSDDFQGKNRLNS